jgi:hypothetical protein
MKESEPHQYIKHHRAEIEEEGVRRVKGGPTIWIIGGMTMISYLSIAYFKP